MSDWQTRARAVVERLTRDRAAVALVLVAALLRFYHLGSKSLWLDEIFAADTTRFTSFGEVLDFAMSDPQEMPLVNILAWGLRWLGNGEWVVRLPAALTSTFSVLALYALGNAFGRRRTGLIAGALLAVYPYSIGFGQEARPYAFLMLLTTLQMLFAWRAARFNRVGDWLWLAACSILNIYSHVLALAATGAAFLFVGVVLTLPLVAVSLASAPRIVGRALLAALRWFQRSTGAVADGPAPQQPLQTASDERPAASIRVRRLARRAGPRLVAAAFSAGIVFIAYLPWIPQLNAFLAKDAAAASAGPPPPPATLTGALDWLATLNFSGLLLVLLAAGIATAALDVARGRWKQPALIALWVGVPLGIFWFQLGAGMFSAFNRYFACVVPAGVLLVAMGVDGIAATALYLARHSPSSMRRPDLAAATSGIVSIGVCALLLVQILPILVGVYAWNKHDYRGVADHILQSSAGDSTVLAVGNCGTYVVKSLPYYFRIRHSSIAVIDGNLVDDRAIERLTKSKGTVWAVRFAYCSTGDEMGQVTTTGLDIRQYLGLELVRQQPPAPTAMGQASAVLEWAKSFSPSVGPSLELARAFASGRQFGESLLPPVVATSWEVGPSTGRGAEPESFVLRPKAGEVNVAYKLHTDAVVPGRLFVISFEYRNLNFKGQQKVYITTHTQAGAWGPIFPDGGGYLCSPAPNWRPGAFAFAVPPDVPMIQTWLRATGEGTVEFKNVKLRPLQ